MSRRAYASVGTMDKGDRMMAKGGEAGKTYQIKGADVTYYEDSYDEGMLDQFHSYYLNENEFPYKTEFRSKKDLFDTLNDFVSYADMKVKDFYVDEDTIQTSALVKHEKGSGWDEFSAPTEKEKELWKKGEMKLYSAQFVFPYEVYRKEKLEFAKGGQLDSISGTKKHYGISTAEWSKMSAAKKKELRKLSHDDLEAGRKYRQGYNDKLDESLGNTDGKESTKKQSLKDRRDESKGEEKALGKRAYSSVSTMDKLLPFLSWHK